MTNNILSQLKQSSSEAEQTWIITRTLLETQPAALQTAVLAAAVPHWFDGKILAALLEPGANILPECYESLQALSFCESFGPLGHALHDLTRSAVLWHLTNAKKERFKTISRRAHGYFAQSDTPQNSVEAAYHLMAHEPVEGIINFKGLMKNYLEKKEFSAANNLLRNARELTDLNLLGSNETAAVDYQQYLMVQALIKEKQQQTQPHKRQDYLTRTMQHFDSKKSTTLQHFSDASQLYHTVQQKRREFLSRKLTQAEQQKDLFHQRMWLIQLADVDAKDKAYETALNGYNKALALDENDQEAIKKRGEVKAHIGDYEIALADFNKAVELDKNDAQAITGRGKTYQLMGNYESALADFNKAIELDGNDAWAYASRGEIYYQMDNYEAALADFNKAIKLRGKFTENDVRMLETVSGPVAIAIENALLYKKLKRHAKALEKENLRLKSEVHSSFGFHEVIGSSPAMRNLYHMVQKILNTWTTVLIQGETGTGKELIAKVIHYNGFLKNKPFVAENCGALSENLLESELFGHVKGAVTGAIADKKGLFEQADGGTILLDEIGEMPQSMQIKLLRVLQEGQIRPVGGSHTIKVNVRLIACTNRNLYEEVENGNYREDLFYRISVFPITIPPLRERKEDIPLLVSYFLKKFSKRFQSLEPSITPYALELLNRYEWPGNVRELQNEVERAMAMAGPNHPITALELSDRMKPTTTCKMQNHRGETLSEVVERIEKQMITEALSRYKGNRSQAARTLGVTRQGLLNKINRYIIKM